MPTTLFGVAVIVLAASLALAGSALSLGKALADLLVADVEFTHQPSPAGDWTLVSWDRDPGAMGEVVSVVGVGKDVLGVIRVERVIYLGNGQRPRTRWLDAKTVDIEGNSVDIYNGPIMENWHYPSYSLPPK